MIVEVVEVAHFGECESYCVLVCDVGVHGRVDDVFYYEGVVEVFCF